MPKNRITEDEFITNRLKKQKFYIQRSEKAINKKQINRVLQNTDQIEQKKQNAIKPTKSIDSQPTSQKKYNDLKFNSLQSRELNGKREKSTKKLKRIQEEQNEMSEDEDPMNKDEME